MTKRKLEALETKDLQECNCAFIKFDGIQRDSKKAFEYCDKCNYRGMHGMSYMITDQHVFHVRGVEVKQSQAFDYFIVAASQGNVHAWLTLGHCYYYGYGVAQDFKKARHYYGECVKMREATACLMAGNMHYYGHGLAKNYDRAFRWFKKGSTIGKQPSLEPQTERFCNVMIGICYYYGHGVAQNYESAYDYLHRGCDYDSFHPRRDILLGNYYYYGYGVPKNYVKALDYYGNETNSDVGLTQAIKCCHKISASKSKTSMYEKKFLTMFKKSLPRHYFVFAYPMYVKHDRDQTDVLKRTLHLEYDKLIMVHFPQDLTDTIISYLL